MMWSPTLVQLFIKCVLTVAMRLYTLKNVLVDIFSIKHLILRCRVVWCYFPPTASDDETFSTPPAANICDDMITVIADSASSNVIVDSSNKSSQSAIVEDTMVDKNVVGTGDIVSASIIDIDENMVDTGDIVSTSAVDHDARHKQIEINGLNINM